VSRLRALQKPDSSFIGLSFCNTKKCTETILFGISRCLYGVIPLQRRTTLPAQERSLERTDAQVDQLYEQSRFTDAIPLAQESLRIDKAANLFAVKGSDRFEITPAADTPRMVGAPRRTLPSGLLTFRLFIASTERRWFRRRLSFLLNLSCHPPQYNWKVDCGTSVDIVLSLQRTSIPHRSDFWSSDHKLSRRGHWVSTN
jgi:hypothetical protein